LVSSQSEATETAESRASVKKIVPRTKMTITAAEEKKMAGFVLSLRVSCNRLSMSGTFR
jgi:hypothetical protein